MRDQARRRGSFKRRMRSGSYSPLIMAQNEEW
jgi:hypothetical protein